MLRLVSGPVAGVVVVFSISCTIVDVAIIIIFVYYGYSEVVRGLYVLFFSGCGLKPDGGTAGYNKRSWATLGKANVQILLLVYLVH